MKLREKVLHFYFVNDLVILCIHRICVFYKTRRLSEPSTDVQDHSSLLFLFLTEQVMLSQYSLCNVYTASIIIIMNCTICIKQRDIDAKISL